jgi:hypothetical protein
MARFCIATGLAPSVFWDLTLEEYEYFVRELNRRKA